MDLIVTSDGAGGWTARLGDRQFRCALGPAGPRRDKREGDGATPIGRFPLRQVLYRPDRLARPEGGLPQRRLTPEDGWCDDPADPAYNRPVRLPYAARHERLWREDAVYDVIVVIGHNDDSRPQLMAHSRFVTMNPSSIRPSSNPTFASSSR